MENSEYKVGNVLVVSHGGIIRLVIDHLDMSYDTRELDNSSISKVIYENGSYKVESVNDNSYMEKGKAMKEAATEMKKD